MMKDFIMNQIGNCRVMVVGDAMLDKYYFGEVTRISPEAPVPINHVTKIKETLGGASNVAHNLSLLGCQTFLVGNIGLDNHGDTLIEKLISRRIDTSGVIRSNQETTTKIRVISGHQQMLRLDFEDTAEVNAEKLLPNVFSRLENVDAVIISDYGKGVCTENVCREIIRECRRLNKIVVVDPKGDYWEKYSGANFITPNLKELNAVLPKKISNDDDEIENAAIITINKYNLNGLLVTRSAQGLSIINKSKSTHIKAIAQEVFDVSGAGDTVIATFTAALAANADEKLAAQLANQAAGIVVAKIGTYAVSQEELLTAIERGISK